MSREHALKAINPLFEKHDLLIGTTGFLSRELFELKKKGSANRDFYTVGSMGYASSIALGIA